MRGLRKGNVALSKAPVLPGARSADMAQGIERYPFQLYTYTRTGLVAWVLSGADVDDTMAWCDALKRAGVKGSIQLDPKRKSMTARARHSLQQLVSPGGVAQAEIFVDIASGQGEVAPSSSRISTKPATRPTAGEVTMAAVDAAAAAAAATEIGRAHV